MIEFAYNTSVQKSTGKTPFEVETGATPPSSIVLVPLRIRPSYGQTSKEDSRESGQI